MNKSRVNALLIYRFFLSLGLCIALHTVVQAQKNTIAKAQVNFPVEKDQSIIRAQELAIEQAKIQAIENEFGRIIYQSNQTYIRNSSGKEVETQSSFISIGNSLVRGEWIRSIEEKCSDIKLDDQKRPYITCEVKGEIREIIEPPILFTALPLECTEGIHCQEIDFKHLQDFFFYFKAPVNGYLTIFVADDSLAQCILPYYDEKMDLFAVNKDQEYIFFKPGDRDSNFAGYYMSTEKNVDQNIFYIIFSPQEFTKPMLTDPNLKGGPPRPKEMSIRDFHQWLGRARSVDKKIQLQKIPVSIKKI